jgi:hypothetical protein
MKSDLSRIEAWRIMPFYLFYGGTEWWILSWRDSKVIGSEPTEQQAFDKAMAHNKTMNIPAVYVHGACMKGGGWKRELTKPQ